MTWSRPSSSFSKANQMGLADPQSSTQCYDSSMWKSTIDRFSNSALDKDRSEHMDRAKASMQCLEKASKLMIAPGSSFTQSDESSQISTLRGQVKTEIINTSWKAVFAKEDNEFNGLMDEIRSKVDGLGFKQVLTVDMKNAKDQNTAHVNVKKRLTNCRRRKAADSTPDGRAGQPWRPLPAVMHVLLGSV